jgi:hypothetical protein
MRRDGDETSTRRDVSVADLASHTRQRFLAHSCSAADCPLHPWQPAATRGFAADYGSAFFSVDYHSLAGDSHASVSSADRVKPENYVVHLAHSCRC